MDDESSILSSIYFDTTSITSDSTIPAEFYHTPTGSIQDICECPTSTNESANITPNFHDLKILETDLNEHMELEKNQLVNEETEIIEPTTNELLLACPIIEKQSSIKEIDEASAEPSPKKRSWKRDFMRRLSFSRSRIMKSFSFKKENMDSASTRNIFRILRHSFRRKRSFDKNSKSKKSNKKDVTKSASVVLGSDCDYFNFEKDLDSPDGINRDDPRVPIDVECLESTPIKPRRQFTQEKYLTGSEDILKKAFNSLKRKSHLQDNKSLFDICSTVSWVFINDINGKPPSATDVEIKVRKFIDNCVNSFIKVHDKQIENSLEMINKAIGQHIDLFSDDLDIINRSKKYQITELHGSKGVCVVTNLSNKRQFVALKRNCSKNWILFNSFLQHTQEVNNLFPDQEWICFPAQSITNLYIENNYFSSVTADLKLLLNAIIQLVMILYSQMMNNLDVKINPFNVMLISSNLSIIFVFVETIEDNNTVDVDNEVLSFEVSNDSDIRRTYQDSLTLINKYVERFLSLPGNISHLITASYPLDYLFFLLLKLNKDNVTDNM